MKKIVIALSFAFFSSTAFADAQDAADEIKDAVSKMEDAAKSCRELRSALKDLRLTLLDDPSDTQLRRAAEKLENLNDDVSSECPKKVAKHIDAAIEALQGRGHSTKVRAQAGGANINLSITTGTSEKKSSRGDGDTDEEESSGGGYQCWNKKDSGCNAKRHNQRALDKEEFANLLKALRNMKPNTFAMQELLEKSFAESHLTSMQLGTLLDLFKPNSIAMVDVVKFFAARIVDPKKSAGYLADSFKPNTISTNEAVEAVASAAKE